MNIIKSCECPCLSHCSTKFNTLYFILCLVFGLILTTFMIKYFLKKRLGKITTNKIESNNKDSNNKDSNNKYIKNIRQFLTNERISLR
jgi:predicted membrane protein